MRFSDLQFSRTHFFDFLVDFTWGMGRIELNNKDISVIDLDSAFKQYEKHIE